MEKKQILARLIFALNAMHEFEYSYVAHDDVDAEAKSKYFDAAEDALYDIRIQLEKELFNEGEESEEHVRRIVATS